MGVDSGRAFGRGRSDPLRRALPLSHSDPIVWLRSTECVVSPHFNGAMYSSHSTTLSALRLRPSQHIALERLGQPRQQKRSERSIPTQRDLGPVLPDGRT